MRAAILTLTLVGCGGTAMAPDAAATTARVHVRWSYFGMDGSPIDCLTVGEDSRIVLGFAPNSPTITLPCSYGEYVTEPMSVGTPVYVRVEALDAAGRMVASDYQSAAIDHAGVVDLDPIAIQIFDEPLPEINALVAGAKASFPSPVTPTSQFPPTAGPNPAVGSCCPHACTPDATIWTQTPTWIALGYPGDDRKYRWSYEFDSQGSGLQATFQIHAWSDIDCDGVYGHWEIDGHVDASGTVVAGPLQKLVDGE